MKGEPLPFCSTAPSAERFYTVAATIYVKMVYPVHNITSVLSINLSTARLGCMITFFSKIALPMTEVLVLVLAPPAARVDSAPYIVARSHLFRRNSFSSGRVGRIVDRAVRRGLLLRLPCGGQGDGVHQELPDPGRPAGEAWAFPLMEVLSTFVRWWLPCISVLLNGGCWHTARLYPVVRYTSLILFAA